MYNNLKIEIFKKYLERWNEDKYIKDIHLTSDGDIEYHELKYEVWEDNNVSDKASELIDSTIDELNAVIDKYIPSEYKDCIIVDVDKIQKDYDICSDEDIIEQSGYSMIDSVYLNGNDYYIVEKE